MSTPIIETVGLRDFERLLQQLGEGVDLAASTAINDTVVFARRLGSVEIRRRINFKANYIDGGRLVVSRRAKETDLEAVVTARDRPTSLARFGQGSPRFGRQRVAPRVRVSARGGSQSMRNAFYMRLRRGSGPVTAENSNVGLAIRLREGERINNKAAMVPVGGNIYLLYGPSVAQVYRTVSENTSGEVGDHLAARFAAQLTRHINGR